MDAPTPKNRIRTLQGTAFNLQKIHEKKTSSEYEGQKN